MSLERLTEFVMERGDKRGSILGICPKKKAVEWSGQTVSESVKIDLAKCKMAD